MSGNRHRAAATMHHGNLTSCGFMWDCSRQGGDYWYSVYNNTDILRLRGRKRRKLKQKLMREATRFAKEYVYAR